VIGALVLGVPSGIGYPLLFGFVFAESAGALVPGETALIVAAALAGNGKLSLPIVIALAALGAVLGDNLGYLIGRTALRRLLARSGAMRSRRARAIQRSEAFFNRHVRAAADGLLADRADLDRAVLLKVPAVVGVVLGSEQA
jgi:membrane protein DedA with SNARE-associated domain